MQRIRYAEGDRDKMGAVMNLRRWGEAPTSAAAGGWISCRNAGHNATKLCKVLKVARNPDSASPHGTQFLHQINGFVDRYLRQE